MSVAKYRVAGDHMTLLSRNRADLDWETARHYADFMRSWGFFNVEIIRHGEICETCLTECPPGCAGGFDESESCLLRQPRQQVEERKNTRIVRVHHMPGEVPDNDCRECVVELAVTGDLSLAKYNTGSDVWRFPFNVPRGILPRNSVARWAYLDEIFTVDIGEEAE